MRKKKRNRSSPVLSLQSGPGKGAGRGVTTMWVGKEEGKGSLELFRKNWYYSYPVTHKLAKELAGLGIKKNYGKVSPQNEKGLEKKLNCVRRKKNRALGFSPRRGLRPAGQNISGEEVRKFTIKRERKKKGEGNLWGTDPLKKTMRELVRPRGSASPLGQRTAERRVRPKIRD